jgi:hypothetical protein
MPAAPRFHARPAGRRRTSLISSALLGALLMPLLAQADPFPPEWGPPNEAGGPVHFAPVP